MFDKAASCCSGKNLTPYADCLKLIETATLRQLPTTLPLSEAMGLVLAKDLTAPMSVPSFNNSAMDGFAFASRAVKDATTTAPVYLSVVGASIAGDTACLFAVGHACCVKIMTGAPIPVGTDTVLPVEAASWDHEEIRFEAPYPAGRHVRTVGQDVPKGTVVLKAGTWLESRHLPLLCAIGIGRVPVYPRVRTSWISTGQEICDDLDMPLTPGHIYNATRLYGHAAATDMMMDFVSATTVKDTPEDFAAALEGARSHTPRVILSTGGVSAGQYDFVKPVLLDAGAEIIFHKANIKPAKPVLFARLPDGTYFFGLPGNPISTALALRAFVYPLVRVLCGLEAEETRFAKLAVDIELPGDKTSFLMATVSANSAGQLIAEPHSRQQSFQTGPFAACNAWIVVPEGTSRLSAGSLVSWLPTNPAS